MLNIHLEQAIQEYGEAMIAFHANVGPSSKPPSPEIKVISDRFFTARDALEEVCKEESDNPLAQRFAETAALVHENTTLLLDDHVGNQAECVKRMKDHKNAELALLGF